jgi:DNA-binding GntR family transcriptional regulator
VIQAFQKPRPLASEVYAHLRSAILDGEYLPAERLGEVELTARLGVSRTPVREALLRLGQAGLLEVLPGRGARVRVISQEEARGVYVVRATLDALAAELAAVHHTPADADALVTALAVLEAAQGREYREQTRLDLAYHRAITQAGHNAPLADLARDLEHRVALIKHQTRRYNAHPQTSAQHRALLDAILARDPAAARQAATLHVQTFAVLVQAELAAPQHPDPPPVPLQGVPQ